MKFKIMHESKGRIRVQFLRGGMTLAQADLLEAYLQNLPTVRQATVHERTRCAVVRYQGDRESLLRDISSFSYTAPAVVELMPSTAAGPSTGSTRKS